MGDVGRALAVFHMVPRVPAVPNLLFVHPPADLRKVLQAHTCAILCTSAGSAHPGQYSTLATRAARARRDPGTRRGGA